MEAPPIIVEVALERALGRLLDYQVPGSLQGSLQLGARVEVPLRGHPALGYVVGMKTTSSYSPLQSLSRICSEELSLPHDLLTLAEWISRYYCTPMGKVLQQMVPSPVRSEMGNKQQLFVSRARTRDELAAITIDLRRTRPQQALVLDVMLKVEKGMLLTALMERADVSRSPIDSLVEAGHLNLALCALDRSPLQEAEYFLSAPKKLNEQQATALAAISSTLTARHFAVHLIHGITGSGKTEIYLQAMDQALAEGKSVLLMVPEIALTTQAVERFRARFPNQAAILHHRMSDGERYDQWQKLRRGELHVAIGARSVVYAPLQNLGLIIVDEEHESSYKSSEEMPCTHARDVAIVRGRDLQATVLLGSATPSLESMTHALSGRYQLHRLDARAEASSLPAVKLIDLRQERERGNFLFSDALIQALEARVERGEQAMIFLNRRGYFTLQICLACQQAVQCPHCAISLTFHRDGQVLSCHCCGYELTPPPQQCPACQSAQTLRFKGVGTEQVESQLRKRLPHVRTLRLDADTTKHKGSHEQILRQFGSGKADVLIGTQMIAKGLHFPAVTLVGILNADAGLQVPDFRAAETTFQLLTQVAGRAGRGKLPGEVIIQTSMPQHPILRFAVAQDYSAFYTEEEKGRRLFGFPPYSRLARIICSGEDACLVEETCQQIEASLRSLLPPEVEIFPVLPCGRSKAKDQYRFHILVKAPRPGMVQSAFSQLKTPKTVRMLLDLDPTSTFF